MNYKKNSKWPTNRNEIDVFSKEELKSLLIVEWENYEVTLHTLSNGKLRIKYNLKPNDSNKKSNGTRVISLPKSGV